MEADEIEGFRICLGPLLPENVSGAFLIIRKKFNNFGRRPAICKVVPAVDLNFRQVRGVESMISVQAKAQNI